jgi:hypothetical protein
MPERELSRAYLARQLLARRAAIGPAAFMEPDATKIDVQMSRGDARVISVINQRAARRAARCRGW